MQVSVVNSSLAEWTLTQPARNMQSSLSPAGSHPEGAELSVFTHPARTAGNSAPSWKGQGSA